MARPAESDVGERSASERLAALRAAGRARAEPALTPAPGSGTVRAAEPASGSSTARAAEPAAARAPMPSSVRALGGGPPGGPAEAQPPPPPLVPGEVTAPLPVLPGVTGRLGRLAERWLPSGWLSARLDPGRPGAVALAVVAVVAAAVAAIGVWRDRPVAEAPPTLAAAGSSPAADRAPLASAKVSRPGPGGGTLVVSVAGKVHHPGLVHLPDGSRVADAIAQVGGPLHGTDLTSLNLARRVADGEQILVGLPQPAGGADAWVNGNGPPGGSSAPGPTAAGTGPSRTIDLNRATVEQLDTLPGIGPVTAQRILQWRAQHGRFSSVEQLREVDGIGERRFAQLRNQVTV